MTTNSDAQAIIDNALRSAQPHPVDETGKIQAFVVPVDSNVVLIDTEQYEDGPWRKKGRYAVHDADSFVGYFNKHAAIEAEVWADMVNSRIVGVCNAHSAGDAAGWEDHRVTYAVQQTLAWQAWVALDGKLLDQSRFAEHIEDRTVDIVDPSAAHMLELAQTFQATIGVSFESSKQLSSGERQLSYRENVDAKAGKAGQLDIPQAFKLALRPFEGADLFGVTARLRYRITGGQLAIGFRLERPEDVLREAFSSVVEQVEEGVSVPVLRGVPA